jgi:hypothetical protein
MASTLLVPCQWLGSVEHFYHFMLGYYLPLVLELAASGRKSVVVRDCGPMNPWLHLLRATRDVEIIPPGIMLHRFVRGAEASVVLEPLDDPSTFDASRFRAFRQAFTEVTGTPVPADPRVITLVDRGPSDPFFLDGRAEISTSAGERRSIPNINDLAHELAELGAMACVDTADMTPVDQVELMGRTSVLVAQHGAGLTNMVWMTPGSSAVEIRPPRAFAPPTLFGRLAEALDLSLSTVRQTGPHAPVAVDQVGAAVRASLGQPPSTQ